MVNGVVPKDVNIPLSGGSNAVRMIGWWGFSPSPKETGVSKWGLGGRRRGYFEAGIYNIQFSIQLGTFYTILPLELDFSELFRFPPHIMESTIIVCTTLLKVFADWN